MKADRGKGAVFSLVKGKEIAISGDDNAEFGECVNRSKIIYDVARARAKKALQRVPTGEYTREFVLEKRAGAPTPLSRQPMAPEKVGALLREKMPGIVLNRLVDTRETCG